MEKTRHLFEKIGDSKGTFHTNTGTIKNWNGKYLTETEEIKKRWQECTEELNKKVFMTWTKWWCGCSPRARQPAVWSQVSFGKHYYEQAIGGDWIPAKLFKILKDDAVKVLHLICQQIWKTQQWPQDWKRSVFIQIPKKGNGKECSNYHKIVLISQASKIMLKILQARL